MCPFFIECNTVLSVFQMQEPAPAIFAGTLYAVSEPSVRLHSGAGAHYAPGRPALQTGGEHISSTVSACGRFRSCWLMDALIPFTFPMTLLTLFMQ